VIFFRADWGQARAWPPLAPLSLQLPPFFPLQTRHSPFISRLSSLRIFF